LTFDNNPQYDSESIPDSNKKKPSTASSFHPSLKIFSKSTIPLTDPKVNFLKENRQNVYIGIKEATSESCKPNTSNFNHDDVLRPPREGEVSGVAIPRPLSRELAEQIT
jgi:hypothetical protein